MDKLKILLVDDHLDTGAALKMLLERRGFEVHTAHDVAGALAIGGTLEIDLLVSDIGLPDGSGIDLLTELRSKKGTLKAVAVSGFCTQKDIEESLNAGFSAHLTKPFSFPDLERELRRLTAGEKMFDAPSQTI